MSFSKSPSRQSEYGDSPSCTPHSSQASGATKLYISLLQYCPSKGVLELVDSNAVPKMRGTNVRIYTLTYPRCMLAIGIWK